MHEWSFSPMWRFLCPFKEFACEKHFSHWSHWKGFSPVWVLLCDFNLAIPPLMVFSQFGQDIFLTPPWKPMCFLRQSLLLNVLLHWGHGYSYFFSPCVFLWILRVLLSLNLLPHCSQENFFMSVWDLRVWSFKTLEDLRIELHRVHGKGPSTTWVFLWVVRSLWVFDTESHWFQFYFSPL